jgi:thiol-disulfide isomerase/thioredoxin
VKENPESIHFISSLAATIGYYDSPDNIKKIYDLFSPAMKSTNYGKVINQYFIFLHSKFRNSILPTWDTGALETIIQDTTKYNLIIFTGSWCKPCLEEIPLLKEIYDHFKGNLLMTSISIDESNTVQNWIKLMLEKNITWRSLLATNEIQSIKEKYHVYYVPYSILVYPSGNFESIDVKKDSDKEKLYSLIEEGISNKAP